MTLGMFVVTRVLKKQWENKQRIELHVRPCAGYRTSSNCDFVVANRSVGTSSVTTEAPMVRFRHGDNKLFCHPGGPGSGAQLYCIPC